MANIEIFLSNHETQDETRVSFLSIPRSDIDRLAVSPFRWIRYVMFAICGVGGDLYSTPNGPAVNYESTIIAENKYYYRPLGNIAFVDYEGLNDRITTAEGSTRDVGFRNNIIQRDGPACVVTEVQKVSCDAAHLIPDSKGNEYIQRMMQLRSPGDRPEPLIDMKENGIFLRKDLHSILAKGQVAFIKTPNYGLGPEHIKRFRRGGEREAYITLQWIQKPEDFDPRRLQLFRDTQNAGMDILPDAAHGALQNVDALFRGEGVPLPDTVILDYLYGVAAYRAWRSNGDDGFNQMRAYRNKHYASIPPPPPPAPRDDTNDADVSSGPDDPNDADYKPPQPRKRHTATRESGLEEAMDELNMFLMYIKGITPEMAAERRQKEIDREERAAQEASRSKVMEWRNHMIHSDRSSFIL